MSHKDELKYIEDHFNGIDKETLIKDLIECGLGSISDPTESGALPLYGDMLFELVYIQDHDLLTKYEYEAYYEPEKDSTREAA